MKAAMKNLKNFMWPITKKKKCTKLSQNDSCLQKKEWPSFEGHYLLVNKSIKTYLETVLGSLSLPGLHPRTE